MTDPKSLEDSARELTITNDGGFFPFNMEQKERYKRTLDALREVRAEAFEEAAKIAEFHSGPSIHLAEILRAKAQELK